MHQSLSCCSQVVCYHCLFVCLFFNFLIFFCKIPLIVNLQNLPLQIQCNYLSKKKISTKKRKKKKSARTNPQTIRHLSVVTHLFKYNPQLRILHLFHHRPLHNIFFFFSSFDFNIAASFFIVQQIHLTLKVRCILGFGIAQNDVK